MPSETKTKLFRGDTVLANAPGINNLPKIVMAYLPASDEVRLGRSLSDEMSVLCPRSDVLLTERGNFYRYYANEEPQFHGNLHTEVAFWLEIGTSQIQVSSLSWSYDEAMRELRTDGEKAHVFLDNRAQSLIHNEFRFTGYQIQDPVRAARLRRQCLLQLEMY